MAAALIDRDGHQPRFQATIAADAVRSGQQLGQYFLHYIFAVAIPAHQPVRQSQQPGAVDLRDQLQRAFFAPPEPLDEELLRGLVQECSALALPVVH